MNSGEWGKRAAVVVVVFAVAVAATAPTALGASASADDALGATDGEVPTQHDGEVPAQHDGEAPAQQASSAQREPPSQQEPPAENNSSVAHRNPSEVSDDSLDDVEVWISREMADRLSESADVSQADRERARELLGNDSEYAELAAEYAEVTNRSGSEGGLENAGNFAIAGQLQRQFFAEVETYHQLHAEYRDARASNETNRTLRLAHELERQTDVVNRTAVRLNRSYANISDAGQTDVRNATRTIGELRGNVTRTQQTVRDRTLVRTELSVQATETEGSFIDPIPLTGRLRTAEGDPIADETVALRVGNRTLNVTTDAEGRFEASYRPTHAQVGTGSRSVTFRPGNDTAYLWANATAEFGVGQVTPNVTVSNRTETVRYNETLTVNGSVAAGGVGVPGVPVVVTVDGVRVAWTRTGENGSFGAVGRLPGNVSNGSQSVSVQVVPRNVTQGAHGPGARGPSAKGPGGVGQSADRGSRSDSSGGSELGPLAEPARNVAIAPANGSAGVTVERSPTALSITDVRTYNETVLVAGQLATEGGEPLRNRTVELRIGNRSVGTATTNATGGFATTVGLPSRLLGGDSTVRVVAAYSPSGGNLAPAQTSALVEVGSTGALVSDRQLRYGALGLLGLAALGAFVWWFRSSSGESFENEGGSGEGGAAAQAGERSGERGDARERPVEALFDSATTALDAGDPDPAVVAAYGAIRRRLDGRAGATPRTHWEFYAECRDAGLSDEPLERLERLTGTYERAAFADESVPEADAREAVTDARALRSAMDGDDGIPDDGLLDAGRSGSRGIGRERTERGGPDIDESVAD